MRELASLTEGIDTGDVADDLVEFCRRLQEAALGPTGWEVLLASARLRRQHPEGRFSTELYEIRFKAVSDLIRRGISRGQLPAKVRVDLMADRLLGLIVGVLLCQRRQPRRYWREQVEHEVGCAKYAQAWLVLSRVEDEIDALHLRLEHAETA